jgi:hypothetical protein
VLPYEPVNGMSDHSPVELMVRISG